MRQSHAEMLPTIRAENEAWRAEHLPRLRAAQAVRDDNRRRVAALMQEAFAKRSPADRDLISKLTGFAILDAADAAKGVL